MAEIGHRSSNDDRLSPGESDRRLVVQADDVSPRFVSLKGKVGIDHLREDIVVFGCLMNLRCGKRSGGTIRERNCYHFGRGFLLVTALVKIRSAIPVCVVKVTIIVFYDKYVYLRYTKLLMIT